MSTDQPKFTPGPWTIYDQSDPYRVKIKARNQVCVTSKENANLIAAAPDLYEALRIGMDEKEPWGTRYAVMLAALSKAEGKDKA